MVARTVVGFMFVPLPGGQFVIVKDGRKQVEVRAAITRMAR
jgi:hypothetical protein